MRSLSADEVDEVLTRNGIGVLALYDGEFPYPIPMSFGYDPAEPLFVMQFGTGESSRRDEALATTQKAGFAVYEETEPGAAWRSVVVTGELREVPDGSDEAADAFAALAANAEFAPDLTVWGVSFEETNFSLVELDIEGCEGRAFSTTSEA